MLRVAFAGFIPIVIKLCRFSLVKVVFYLRFDSILKRIKSIFSYRVFTFACIMPRCYVLPAIMVCLAATAAAAAATVREGGSLGRVQLR